MNHCCVPFCKSSKRKKEKTGFFEVPYKIKQRLLWQNAIIQACVDNGIDENLCNFAERSVVCEKHFTKGDLSISTTRKRVLPSAIPSIFYNFSTVKQANFSNINEFSNTVLVSPFKNSTPDEELKTKISLNYLKENGETSLKQVTTSDDESFNQNTKYHTQKVKKETNCLRKPIIIKLDTTVSLTSEQNTPFECSNSSENLEFYLEEDKKEPRCKDKDLTKHLHNRLKILKRQNTNLRCRMKQTMKKYASLTSNEKNLSLEEEQFKKKYNEKAEKELPSTLLFEQIQNFGKKKTVLSDSALKFYFMCQKQFPGDYDFVRKRKLFALPHRNTLAKYVEFSPEEEDQSLMQVTISDEDEAIGNGVI